MDEEGEQHQEPAQGGDRQPNERSLALMANEDEVQQDLASDHGDLEHNEPQVASIFNPSNSQQDEAGDGEEEGFQDALEDLDNRRPENDRMAHSRSQEEDSDTDGDSNDNTSAPGTMTNESPLPSAREHSYLPGNSHPLMVASPDGGRGPSSPRPTQRNSTNNNKRARPYDEGNRRHNGEVEDDSNDFSIQTTQQLINMPVMQLPGVVLFPGMTLPIRLRERALIPYLARQIELCRTTPHLQPQVRIGIITYVPHDHRLQRRQSRAGGRQREQEQQQRRRRRRRRFIWRRRSRRSEDDSSSLSGDEEDGEEDVSNIDHSQPAVSRHPLVTRMGTIATVAYTHELAALDNPTLGDSIESTRRIFRNHLDDNELVVTAVGTNRFRVVSYVQEESFADLNVFQVEEIIDKPLCLPRLGRPLISFPVSKINKDGDGKDLEEIEGISLPNPRVARHNQLLWNLASVTPIPYCAYKATWPWKLVDCIVAELEAHHGGDNLPSLRDVLVSGNKSKIKESNEEVSSLALEPTKFSYTMSYNMPFSDDEKLELLQIDSTLERLRVIYDKVMEYATKESFVFCKGCDTKLSGVTSVFTVGGAEGATSNYVNPNGFIHQITTLRQVEDSRLLFQGRPQTDNSYFPGYSWTITYCNGCYSLLGWKFQRVISEKSTENRPDTFFGFMSSELVTHE